MLMKAAMQGCLCLVRWTGAALISSSYQGICLKPNLDRMPCTVMQVATLLEEYFSSGDLGEAAAELADMGEPELQHFFVKRAVTAALDKHNREREMTSILLSSLYSEVRPHE